MDSKQFDDLSRSLGQARATGTRRGFIGALAGLLAAGASWGERGAEARPIRQAGCGNKRCGRNPDACTDGCVCCVYGNGNARCRPPGTCSPGEEICPEGKRFCANLGRCDECCIDADCEDGVTCTENYCVDGACETGYRDERCAASGACEEGRCLPGDDGADATTGCLVRPVTCDDGDPCTAGSCDPIDGCVYTPLSDTPCGAAGDAVCCAGVCCEANQFCSTINGCTQPNPIVSTCSVEEDCPAECTLGCFPDIGGTGFCAVGSYICPNEEIPCAGEDDMFCSRTAATYSRCGSAGVCVACEQDHHCPFLSRCAYEAGCAGNGSICVGVCEF